MELYLVEESALEGTVEVAGEVGGGDEYTIQVLNLLQDDVLHGVVHLVDRVLDVLGALVDERIGLVEEQDGLYLAVLAYLAVAGKHGLDVLLALAHELIAHAGDVHLHQVATRLTGYLQHSLGLAGTRASVEQTGKALAHALLLQTLLDAGEVVDAEQTGESLNLLLLAVVEEQFLGLDGVVALKHAVVAVLIAAALAVTGLVGRQQLLLGPEGKLVLLVVGHAVAALVLDVAGLYEGVDALAQVLAQEVAIKILGVQVANGFHGEALAVAALPLGIVEHNHEQQRLHVGIVEAQHLVAEGQVRVGLAQLNHPLLVVAELGVTVVQALGDMALEFVDELLLGESVNLLGNEHLIMAQGGDKAASQCEAFEETAYLVGATAYEPALAHHLLDFVGVGHHLQARAVQVVAHLLPRQGFTSLDEHGQYYYLDIVDAQLAAQESQGILNRLPELIGEFGAACLVEHTVHGGDDGPGVGLLVLLLLIIKQGALGAHVKIKVCTSLLNFQSSWWHNSSVLMGYYWWQIYRLMRK